MIGESLNLEIWNRLIQDKSLDGLSLPSKDGRLDLNGLDLPDPLVIRRFEFKGRPVSEIEPGVVIRGAKWQNLDFSGSRLRGMRLFGCDIENCRFDDCRLEGLRMWSMSIRDTSFKGADLRNSALGGVQDGTRNVFVGSILPTLTCAGQCTRPPRSIAVCFAIQGWSKSTSRRVPLLIAVSKGS